MDQPSDCCDLCVKEPDCNWPDHCSKHFDQAGAKCESCSKCEHFEAKPRVVLAKIIPSWYCQCPLCEWTFYPDDAEEDAKGKFCPNCETRIIIPERGNDAPRNVNKR
jgi:hypothetical protein